ncbi:MAG: histidinol-phosphate aminotransferase [Roseovarius sp. BRH_c41]|uniref:histidinol-phosphate transaminase n=1 Tax=Roseovarius sp. BRH_c41 TaxID=1629709 RepID=UPI0005F1DD09|nr:histidinol-phosphate transaminase [Roseovarius sp. BRH_c41]KJS42576.1 MAG: histidinol-phosphate aminotransferase [Roseovarius sp. BRH_c41]
MTKITPQPGIMEIALYRSGEAVIAGKSEILKLSANESPYGPSDKAKAAFARSAATLHRYPGTDHADLRGAIAEVHGLDPERVICGVGSDEVLQFVAQAYAGAGDEVIHTEHGFAMYPILAHAVGATPVCVAERDRMVDVDAILGACTPRTRIVFIANPGNPTGTILPEAEVARLADGVPVGAILVLDGAYTEFAKGYDGGVALVEARDNVIMTRTFSKAYGLGGLRIGWGYAQSAMIEVLNRIRQPFNLSPTQLATAEAAVRDQDWLSKVVSDTMRNRAWLTEALRETGVAVDESHANFVLARFASDDEAADCDAALRADGIIVRRVGGYGFPEGLRITVGEESACRRVAHVIGQFKGVR